MNCTWNLFPVISQLLSLSTLQAGQAGVTTLLQGQWRPQHRPRDTNPRTEGLDIWPHYIHTTLCTSLYLNPPNILEGQHYHANFTGKENKVQRSTLYKIPEFMFFPLQPCKEVKLESWTRKFRISKSYSKTTYSFSKIFYQGTPRKYTWGHSWEPHPYFVTE